MSMRFYIPEGDAKARMLELAERRKQCRKRRLRFAKEQAADGVVARDARLVGLIFESATPEGWRFAKKTPVKGHAIPDNTKHGKILRGIIAGREYQDVDSWDIAKALGNFPAFILGRPYTLPQFQILGKVIVVVLDSEMKPKGCRRISDVEYEKLLAKAKMRQSHERKKN